MANIGIMGGTFNPIHIGHLCIAEAAYHQFCLDEVWFMPNHIPAYKDRSDVIDGDLRLQMVSIAIEPYPYFCASDFEIRRNGPTYSAETFRLLHERYTSHRFFFIMGADSLFYFEKWKQPEQILKYSDILVAPRKHGEDNEIHQKIRESARQKISPCVTRKESIFFSATATIV